MATEKKIIWLICPTLTLSESLFPPLFGAANDLKGDLLLACLIKWPEIIKDNCFNHIKI